MQPGVNVEIRIFRGGVLEEVRAGHNVWVDRGRAYLAKQIALTSHDPDVPEQDDRVRYLGVGVGGQYAVPGAVPAAVDAAYPAGSDPFATGGNTYREDFPFMLSGGNYQPVSTLERPVRISGGSTAYPGVAGDVWLVDTPNFYETHINLMDCTVHALIDGSAGDVAYGTFPDVPLTEAGLFLDETGVSLNTAFNPLVAYITFGTIWLNSNVTLEFIWSIKF